MNPVHLLPISRPSCILYMGTMGGWKGEAVFCERDPSALLPPPCLVDLFAIPNDHNCAVKFYLANQSFVEEIHLFLARSLFLER